MNVLVTGSGGYVGSVLVPMLRAAGHRLGECDIGWFGTAPERQVISDFRELDGPFIEGKDAIIHLAAVANDPSGDLDPLLTWKTNAEGTMNLAERAANAGVRQFIHASSGSIYGISSGPCDERAPCVPVSAYNETKKVAERCLLSYADRMRVQIVRPGTVCGVSPRQRLDVMVNQLTIEALTTGTMRLKAPDAMRPHIHIIDMCRLYLWLLDNPDAVGTWNAHCVNVSVLSVAKLISDRTGAKIEMAPTDDRRDYRMDSAKLLDHGFKFEHSVEDAVDELIAAYASGALKDEDRCYNVRWMQRAKFPSIEKLGGGKEIHRSIGAGGEKYIAHVQFDK